MGVKNVSNVQGKSVAQGMTNVDGAEFVHGFVMSNKLWAKMWEGPINYSVGTDVWTKGAICF